MSLDVTEGPYKARGSALYPNQNQAVPGNLTVSLRLAVGDEPSEQCGAISEGLFGLAFQITQDQFTHNSIALPQHYLTDSDPHVEKLPPCATG